MSSSSSSYLMNLPSEIRVLIIQHVIASSRCHCSCSASCIDDVSDTNVNTGSINSSTKKGVGIGTGSRNNSNGSDKSYNGRAEAPDMSYTSWTRECGIDYEVDVRRFQSNVHGLLLTNRALHAETKHEIHRRSFLSSFSSSSETTEGGGGEGPDYVLDVLVTRYGELRPSWMCIPWQTTKVRTLSVKFRVGCFSTFDMGLYYYPISRAWAIYSLLERFIKLGPSAPGPPVLDLDPCGAVSPVPVSVPSSTRPTWQIGKLVLESEETSTSPSRMPRRMFIDVLRTRFTEMTWTSLPTHTYAALLLCHVGCIEFRRGEETLVTWYLEDLIQETDPGAYGRPRFRIKLGDGIGVRYGSYDEWRAAILEVRIKKGLSTPMHLR